MNSHFELQHVVIFLAAAVIAVPIAKRLGLGSVIGYLLAGIAIGPFVLKLIPSAQEVMHFAEFGVVLLLFLIGLELNPKKLWTWRKPIFGAGGAQVLLTIGVLTALAWALGHSPSVSLVAAMGISLSSTAIAVQVLKEKGWMSSAAGTNSFSVLLFQDLAVIPMLAILPFLTVVVPDAAASAVPAWLSVVKSVAAILIVVVGGRFLVRPIFRFIAKTGLREVFTAFSLLLVMGISLLMTSVGLSMALGSFLAGVLLAESEYRHELEIDIEPFKGLLLGLFFISIGLAIDFAVFAAEWATVLAVVGVILAGKWLVSFAVGRMFGMGRRDSAVFAVVLAQGGEFAFVLYGLAGQLGIFTSEVSAVLTLAVAISMVATPFMVILYERFGAAFFAEKKSAREFDKIENENPEVIIAGYGRFGQMVGRVLQALNTPVTILDSDPGQIELLRKFGTKTFYGDASRLDLLQAAGIAQAKLLIVAIDNMETALRIIETVRKAYPKLQIVARARNRAYAFKMINLSVTMVREVAASSIEMAAAALEALGHSKYESYRLTRQFYHYDMQLLQMSARHADDEASLITINKQSREQLTKVMQDDRKKFHPSEEADAWGDSGRE